MRARLSADFERFRRELPRDFAGYVREAGLWYTVADATPVTEAFLEQVREGLYATYGPWQGGVSAA